MPARTSLVAARVGDVLLTLPVTAVLAWLVMLILGALSLPVRFLTLWLGGFALSVLTQAVGWGLSRRAGRKAVQ